MNSKKAFSLFELILVLFIGSIILIYTFIFTKELYQTQNTNEKLASLKIDLNSTKIIIEKNILKNTNFLSYTNKTLFFKNNILLKNVTQFNMNTTAKTLKIDITLEDLISQTWYFNL